MFKVPVELSAHTENSKNGYNRYKDNWKTDTIFVLFTTAEMKNINISEMVRYIFVFLVIKLKESE